MSVGLAEVALAAQLHAVLCHQGMEISKAELVLSFAYRVIGLWGWLTNSWERETSDQQILFSPITNHQKKYLEAICQSIWNKLHSKSSTLAEGGSPHHIFS